MYIIAVIIVVATMTIATGFGGLRAMLDIPSLLIPVLMVAAIVGAAGYSKDFFRGIKCAVAKENIYTRMELMRSRLALKLSILTLFFSGLGTTLIGMVALLSLIEDPASIMPSLSVSMISFTYSIFMMILLMPLDFKLKGMLLELEDANEES